MLDDLLHLTAQNFLPDFSAVTSRTGADTDGLATSLVNAEEGPSFFTRYADGL